jgi:hypothetical protein
LRASSCSPSGSRSAALSGIETLEEKTRQLTFDPELRYEREDELRQLKEQLEGEEYRRVEERRARRRRRVEHGPWRRSHASGAFDRASKNLGPTVPRDRASLVGHCVNGSQPIRGKR